MSTFIEDRLLECVSFGTVGGPTWRTRKIQLRNGVTRRNPLRSMPLYRYMIQYRNLLPEFHRPVMNAFNACMGGVYSFRLKDWHDFQATNVLLPVLGTGAPQTLQLVKPYTFGIQTIYRRLRKPVAGTFSMTANGVNIAGATVDPTTGIASFTAALNSVLRATFEFDVPVMFEQDELPWTGEDRNEQGLILTADVPLVEDIDA